MKNQIKTLLTLPLFILSCVSKHLATDGITVYTYSDQLRFLFLTPILVFILFCVVSKKISVFISNEKWSKRIGKLQYLLLPSVMTLLIVGSVLFTDTATTSSTAIVTKSIFSNEIKQSIQNLKEIDISWEGSGKHCTRYVRFKYTNGIDSEPLPVGSAGTPFSVAINDLKTNPKLRDVYWVETSECNFH